ncbi:MAG TPA: hypothetical protein PLH79_20340, partial [bacterium]|nr:hypothetical protein [bacterium]
LQFEYDDKAPWPEEPDGNGPSLEVRDVNGNYSDPANWKSSGVIHGTPGRIGSDVTAVRDWILHE